jgi:hypothetical protein
LLWPAISIDFWKIKMSRHMGGGCQRKCYQMTHREGGGLKYATCVTYYLNGPLRYNRYWCNLFGVNCLRVWDYFSLYKTKFFYRIVASRRGYKVSNLWGGKKRFRNGLENKLENAINLEKFNGHVFHWFFVSGIWRGKKICKKSRRSWD